MSHRERVRLHINVTRWSINPFIASLTVGHVGLQGADRLSTPLNNAGLEEELCKQRLAVYDNSLLKMSNRALVSLF